MVEHGVKKVDGKSVVAVKDRRSITSRGNPFKHGKRANLPALCDQCVFGRNKDVGGNGKCSEYEEGAACKIRADIEKVINHYDTRNVEGLQTLVDIELKRVLALGILGDIISRMEGNVPDKDATHTNAFVKLGHLAFTLQGTTKMTAREIHGVTPDAVSDFFRREITVERKGDGA